jgi:hypothetical protein
MFLAMLWLLLPIDGPGKVARFATPLGMAIWGTTLYVIDDQINALRKIA